MVSASGSFRSCHGVLNFVIELCLNCLEPRFSLHYVSPRCLADNVFVLHCNLSCVFTLDRAASQLLPGTPPAVTSDLWPAITINAPARGDFGGLAALERNMMLELHGTKPDELMEFRTKLQQPHWIESNTVCFLNHIPLKF
jgi:hypothetical protein